MVAVLDIRTEQILATAVQALRHLTTVESVMVMLVAMAFNLVLFHPQLRLVRVVVVVQAVQAATELQQLLAMAALALVYSQRGAQQLLLARMFQGLIIMQAAAVVVQIILPSQISIALVAMVVVALALLYLTLTESMASQTQAVAVVAVKPTLARLAVQDLY